MKAKVFDPDGVDFYDWDQLDKLQDRRAKKEMKLLLKAVKGDQKSRKALIRHAEEGAILKERAKNTGYYWI